MARNTKRRSTAAPPSPQATDAAADAPETKPSASGRAAGTRKKRAARNTPPSAQPEAADTEQRRSGFPVVGIGASAGGLEALEELLKNMPASTGMAFVVVTHQHPGHTSLLPELLGRTTTIPVVAAADGLKIEPDHIYVGQPGGYLAIQNGVLHRTGASDSEAPKLPIDYFFRSLANDQRERAICIILSGTGSDGTLGLKAIKGKSGMVMVEDPASAKYSGMPASAIATSLADFVAPPSAMPEQLLAYVSGLYRCDGATSEAEHALEGEPMQRILTLLRARTSHDFSAYKPNTLRRRIERRMNVHQIPGPQPYIRYLEENPHELDLLFQELLISVTSFFRDPETWQALLDGPLPELLQSRPEGATFRAWIPGCSSGEEVYSLAICLHECLEKLKRHFDVQLFGTDLDGEAINAARIGQYPHGIASDVSPARLERYFVPHDAGYRIRTDIRDMAVFAVQNVIKDPPFTKLDFLSCRNLLIYLNSDLQKWLLPIFHYALKPGGLLILGSSETVGTFIDLFEAVDKRWKIYRRKEAPAGAYILPEIPAQSASHGSTRTRHSAAGAVVPESPISRLVERLLLGSFAPPSVVVNDRGDVVYIHGRTGAYLEPTPGQPRHNVLEMAREGLKIDLAAALRHAVTQSQAVVRKNVRVKSNGGYTSINLTVSRIQEPETIRGLLLVTFTPAPARRKTKELKSTHDDTSRIAELERELLYSHESLQSTVEELETSNEELKSTNEELQSTNEELQSTNEELETSKEELQSLNEELTTVNAELQSKVDDLSQATDDMQNLLNSTDIATIFLDNDLTIKRFTSQATGLIKLRSTDVGRPIAELASNIEYESLLADCGQVLATLTPRETEVAPRTAPTT